MNILKDSLKSVFSKICDYALFGLVACALFLIASALLFAPSVIAHGLGAVVVSGDINALTDDELLENLQR